MEKHGDKKVEEFIKNMYKGNRYTCKFCGKEIVDKPELALCACKGMSCYDIAEICENCLKEIEEKAVF